jgi:glucose-1-phosphate thymidylyltransferase
MRPYARCNRPGQGELEITHARPYLVGTRADVRSTAIGGYGKGTGNAGDMLEADRTVLDRLEPPIDGEADDASETVGRVVTEAGARTSDSRIAGPAVMAAGTIAGVGRTESSPIGRHVEVTPAAGVPSAHRPVPEDRSKVQIRS